MLKSWMLSFTSHSPACLPLHAYAIRARPSGWTSTQAPARNGKANKEAGKDADAQGDVVGV